MTTSLRSAVAAVVLAVLAVVTVLVVRGGDEPTAECSTEQRVPPAAVPAVFSARSGAPAPGDPRLRRLVDHAERWGLGEVVGSVGFDYDRWLSVAALPDGLAAWTKDNAVVAVLDDELTARWGIEQAKGRHAYDLGAGTFWQLRLPARSRASVAAYDLDDGLRRWCARIGTRPVADGDPLATATLADGDLAVLAPGPRGGARLSRLDGVTGAEQWHRDVAVDRGDALVEIAPGVLLAGGRPSYELTEPSVPAPAGAALAAVDAATGEALWTAGDGGRLHVLGVADGRVLVEQARRRGLVLRAIDARGRTAWSRSLPRGAGVDGALRGGVLVLRTERALLGLDADTGGERWRRPLPTGRQFLPYGFQLDRQPLLDADHLLLGTTEALVAVDLRSGRWTTYPLPTDGIGTSYWPYQVVTSDDLLAVVTNTGAVVLHRPGG